jgi:hypothetical protein
MAAGTLEDRIREIEDRLEIYNLVASHPPSADTGVRDHIERAWTEDGEFDRGAEFGGPVQAPAPACARRQRTGAGNPARDVFLGAVATRFRQGLPDGSLSVLGQRRDRVAQTPHLAAQRIDLIQQAQH